MAAAPLPLLLLLLLAASASARPCKTIFFFTSTTYNSLPQNPNPNPTPHFITFYLTSPHPHPHHHRFFLTRPTLPTRLTFDPIDQEHHHHHHRDLIPDLPRADSSIKDRTRDIMSVVGALLFGMGCGALTAATMYLVWSLFMPNRFEFEDSDEEEFDGGVKFDDDLYNTKKMAQGGYVAIPTKVVDDQEVEAVAKQGE